MTTHDTNMVRRTAIGALLLAAVLAVGIAGGCGPASQKAPVTPPDSTPGIVPALEDAPGVDLSIVGIGGASGKDGTFKVGDTLTVSFKVLKHDGTPWNLADFTTTGILMSGPTFNYQPVLARQTDLVARSTYKGDGVWSYKFANKIPATYLAPANDSPSFDADDGELQGQSLLAGSYTVGLYIAFPYMVGSESFQDVGNATRDFAFGGDTTIEHREEVTAANCNQCHDALQAHGGSRRDPVLCALCHTAGAEDKNVGSAAGGTPGASIEFKVMIHRIHNGAHLPSVLGVATNDDGSRNYTATPQPYELVGFQNHVTDFSEINFPVFPNLSSAMPKDLGYSAMSSGAKSQEDAIRNGVTACAKCHGDPDGDGPLPAPAEGGIHETQPGKVACASCHDDVDYTKLYTSNGSTMPAQNPGSSCNGCHGVSGSSLSVRDAHTHPLEDSTLSPGVVMSVTAITGGSGGGGGFLAGDKPSLQYTVQDEAGDDVALADLDSATVILDGPTNKRQIVLPYPGANTISTSPYDFAGRLSSSSTTNKGTLQKPVRTGTRVAETLVTEFSTTTAFSVTGTVSGDLGSGALSSSPSTNPSGSSLASTVLTSAAVPQTITVAFLDNRSFTVTGSVSGVMSGNPPPSLPSTTSGSMRFVSTDGTVAFVLSVGSTSFAAGNSIFMTVFQTGAANPMLLPIVAGRTAFSGAAPGPPDRFYLEVIPEGPAYTLAVPMDLTLEHLGDGDGLVGQALSAGNLPVYYGRQTLSEVTALASGTTLTAAAAPQARFVDVASTAGYAAGNTVALDSGAALGTREYLAVGWVESATRMWFATPLRYAHAGGAAVDKATLTFRQEGAGNQYTLNAATGTVTSVAAFGAGNGIVMSYRTDGRFGWMRHNGDALQTVYQPPADDSPDLGEDWGDWGGKHFADGTYTAALWGSMNVYVGLSGETQTYRSAAKADSIDFLYGAGATEIESQHIITSPDNCNACHNDTAFHGLGRRGLTACLMCHQPASEDTPQYSSNSTPPTPGVTVDFRTMLHKIHMGKNLANASTYQVNTSTFAEVEFPSMPGGVKNCQKCHGAGSETWKQPADRDHPTEQGTPVREWRAVCNACHDSDVATAHIETQTSSAGVEACEVCHGLDGEFAVERMHKVR